MTRSDAGRGGELPDAGGAGSRTGEADLDAVVFVLDGGIGEVDFGDYAGDVEAFNVHGGRCWFSERHMGGVRRGNAYSGHSLYLR